MIEGIKSTCNLKPTLSGNQAYIYIYVTGIRTKTFFMEIALFCSSRRVKEKNIKGKRIHKEKKDRKKEKHRFVREQSRTEFPPSVPSRHLADVTDY